MSRTAPKRVICTACRAWSPAAGVHVALHRCGKCSGHLRAADRLDRPSMTDANRMTPRAAA